MAIWIFNILLDRAQYAIAEEVKLACARTKISSRRLNYIRYKIDILQSLLTTVCAIEVVSYLTNLKMRSSQGLLLEPPRDILAPSLPSIRWTVSIIIRKHLIKMLARHIKEVNDYVGFHLTVYNIRVYRYLYPSKCYRHNKKNEKWWK